MLAPHRTATLPRLAILFLLGALASSPAPSQTVLHEFEQHPSNPLGLLAASDGMLYAGTGDRYGALIRINPLTGDVTTVGRFHGNDGAGPWAPPLESGGIVYGTTLYGGPDLGGTLFSYDLQTGELQSLASFDHDLEGARPFAALTGSGDVLYGTNQLGGGLPGGTGLGTVYSFSPATNMVELLTIFQTPYGSFPTTSVHPVGGFLYGTTARGGASDLGTLYSLEIVSGVVTTLVHFSGANGAWPGELTIVGNIFYGTTAEGGAAGMGTIFRFDIGTGIFTTLASFDGVNGSTPNTRLIERDGLLFGTTQGGGSSGTGTLFEFDPTDSSLTARFDFDEAGGMPLSPLVGFAGIPGMLFGGTSTSVHKFDIASGAVTPVATFATAEGWRPAGLVQNGGFLDGITQSGGSSGAGTVVRFDPATGAVASVAQLSDRAEPHLLRIGGFLYGITPGGGALGLGSIFRVNPSTSELLTLASFDGTNGSSPVGALVERNGLIFGAAKSGGAAGVGVVFRFDPATLSLEPVVSFVPGAAGPGSPSTGLTESGGDLYGSTELGFLYRLDPDTLEFVGLPGFGADAELVESAGILYGGRSQGGDSSEGLVFGFDPATEMLTATASFSGETHGAYPSAPLIASGGLLFGTTTTGPGSSRGTLFRFDPAAESLTALAIFEGPDGDEPAGRLVETSPGVLVGTTAAGGSVAGGTIFRLSVLTPELVIQAPASVVPDSAGMEASVPEMPGLSYAWSIAGGSITAGGDTAAVTFTAGAAGSTVELTLEITGDFTTTLTKRVSVDFADVPSTHPLRDWVNTVARNGISSGCAPTLYCPNAPVLRSQMAIFLLRAKESSAYVPPPASGTRFTDVAVGSFAAAWIEELAARNITGGCGSGRYCPGDAVTRAQLAVFLLKTVEGSSYVPPPATGVFSDVPAGDPFAPWIEELAARGITAGCGPGTYCPASPLLRGQMAVFLTRAFGLE